MPHSYASLGSPSGLLGGLSGSATLASFGGLCGSAALTSFGGLCGSAALALFGGDGFVLTSLGRPGSLGGSLLASCLIGSAALAWTAHEPNATAYWLMATAHELMLMAKPMPRPMAQPRGVAHELMAMAEPAPRAVAQPMPRSTKPVPRPMVQPRAISRKHMSMAHVSRAMAHEPRLMAYKLTAMP